MFDYAWYKVQTFFKFNYLRAVCLVHGHDYGQHFREMFSSDRDMFKDETPWCGNCGQDYFSQPKE